MRRLIALGLILLLIAGTSLYLLPTSPASQPTSLHDLTIPSGDPNWRAACTSANLPDTSSSCTQAALFDLNLARTQEGLPRFVPPANFNQLTQAVQLQDLVNNERAIRQLPTVTQSTPQLQRLAMQAAVAARDPDIPNQLVGGSDWAGNFPNAIVVDFMWMYEDGYRYTNGGGGSNLDCQSPHASGCWGHRDVILDNSSTDTHIGTAFTTQLTSSQALTYADSFTLIIAGQPSLGSLSTSRPLARILGVVAILILVGALVGWIQRRRRPQAPQIGPPSPDIPHSPHHF